MKEWHERLWRYVYELLNESYKSKFDSCSRQEKCIDHIPYCLSGLSRGHFFRQPFSKWLYKLTMCHPHLNSSSWLASLADLCCFTPSFPTLRSLAPSFKTSVCNCLWARKREDDFMFSWHCDLHRPAHRFEPVARASCDVLNSFAV